MAVKRVGVQSIPLAHVHHNPLSANEEDGATFNRLREELKSHGMLELPVMLKQGSRYRIIAGHHRVEAWSQLGHDEIDAIVLEGKLSKEEEFNLVNNLNTVRGGLSVSRVKRIIRKNELDVRELDLFKYPLTRLIPQQPKPIGDSTPQRRARIREMALKIAGKVAEVLLDDMNQAVVCFRIEDAPVAVIRLNMSKRSAKKQLPMLKERLMEAFEEWLASE